MKSKKVPIKYRFMCGCIGTKTIIIPNKKGSHIKCCPKHRVKTMLKIMPCMGCGKEVERSLIGSTLYRCDECKEIQRKAKAKRFFKTRSKASYYTADELNFIRTLTPETALKYLPAIEQHVEWDGFNRQRCIEVCRIQAGVV